MSYAHKVSPGSKVKLRKHDPSETRGLNKAAARARFEKLNGELETLQEELYAAGQNAVLIILQGMDTSGKDATIRRVLQVVNPQACRVEAFKAPTAEELAHDFLWRVHKVVPPKGLFGVFNRSHYEDVLIVRVHELVPKRVWKARYDQINEFESMLASSGTIVLKFFLHISKDEQEERLLKRERDPTKSWKLSADDWRERERWDEYMEAYEDALGNCSTADAPWYIVPADRKWYRDLAVSDVLVSTLRHYRAAWRESLKQLSKRRLAELRELRADKKQPTDD